MESGKEVDVEAEKQLLTRLAQEWVQAENRKDVEGVMKFIAEYAICQPPNMPQFIGREAFREFFAKFLKQLVSISGEPTSIEVSAPLT